MTFCSVGGDVCAMETLVKTCCVMGSCTSLRCSKFHVLVNVNYLPIPSYEIGNELTDRGAS